MDEKQRCYIAIDLKSFYASVECVERGLDPLVTNLVVADQSRTEKTICLAVSPALKGFGVPGRPRLFEVVQKAKSINDERFHRLKGGLFTEKSCNADEIRSRPAVALDYIVAPPRMALYIKYSTKIYSIYLKYVAPEDIFAYSIDEVFMDVTDYLTLYGLSSRELAMKIILDVLKNTGITATAGVGTNMYLAKVAMDIRAKHIPADKNGVRIAELDEMSYRRELWNHRPLTDFWRVGRGTAKRLEKLGLFTMGDVALCSVGGPRDYYNEDLLYKHFGVNAELLIDHAWGWEPTTIAEVKAYRPDTNSISSGQVLQQPYPFEKARLVVKEMTDLLVLDLVEKGLVTDQMVLTVGYDIENLKDPQLAKAYSGEVTTDRYGRKVPKHALGTINLKKQTSSTKLITAAVMELFDKIVDKRLSVRRLNVTACNVVPESEASAGEQLSFLSDLGASDGEVLEREKKLQHAVLSIKKKYGKNAVLKGMNLEEGATAAQRNAQIGGHHE